MTLNNTHNNVRRNTKLFFQSRCSIAAVIMSCSHKLPKNCCGQHDCDSEDHGHKINAKKSEISDVNLGRKSLTTS